MNINSFSKISAEALGANFKYHIPNREDEGYGMNSNRIRKLKEEGVEVLLTCDNGK